jgi:ketosteroid isomerase-like protein
VIRELFEQTSDAFGRAAWDEWLSLHAPDIHWETIEGSPDEGTYDGHEAIRKFVVEWFDDFDELALDVVTLDDRGDHGLFELELSGRGKRSGAEMNVRYVQVAWAQDGKWTRIKEFLDLDGAKEWLAQHG